RKYLGFRVGRVAKLPYWKERPESSARKESTSRRPSGRPSTKQKAQRLGQRRIRAGSTETPRGSVRGRSISYSISWPSGCRRRRVNSSSAVRNSQSRKSSSSRPFTATSSVPGVSPSSSPIEPARTAVTLIMVLPEIVLGAGSAPAARSKDGPNILKYQELRVENSCYFARCAGRRVRAGKKIGHPTPG